jgi:hypothetical protein
VTTLSTASQKRIDRFVDAFIRSAAVESLTSERDSDFWNEPERASRVYDAAESGCDGKTHSKVIEDWRDAFNNLLSDHRNHEYPERFVAAVNAHFDGVEQWHLKNGSLYQEIG